MLERGSRVIGSIRSFAYVYKMANLKVQGEGIETYMGIVPYLWGMLRRVKRRWQFQRLPAEETNGLLKGLPAENTDGLLNRRFRVIGLAVMLFRKWTKTPLRHLGG